MSTKTINNWKPVIASLLRTLENHGFTLDEVDNGEDETKLEGTNRERRQKAKAEIDATDESHLYVTHPHLASKVWIFVVLGNEPEELVADCSCSDLLDKATTEFSALWENVRCPQKKVKP